MRGHTLNASLPERAMRVEGSPTQREQGFTHPVDNAMKYTDRGGTLAVTVITEVDGRAEAGSATAGW